MHTKIELITVIVLLLLSPYVRSATGVYQCVAELDYHHQLQLIRNVRWHHTATPIYGVNPSKFGSDVMGFESEIEAVLAASNLYNPASIDQDREYIGAVLERDGNYFYTVGAGDRAQDSVEVRLLIPTSYSIVAFWHTHGAPAYKRLFFSRIDQRLVNVYNKPLYLADYTGMLKVLSPGDLNKSVKTAVDPELPGRRRFSRGGLVLSETGEALNVCTSFKA